MKPVLLLLFIALLGSAPLSAAETTPAKPVAAAVNAKGYKDANVEEFDKLRANKEHVILDVRTPKEFADGHLPGAINIDWYATADFEKKIAALDKSKTYLVHCAVGGRSAKAGEKLATLNFKNVVNLLGGFKAWEQAGKPVVKEAAK